MRVVLVEALRSHRVVEPAVRVEMTVPSVVMMILAANDRATPLVTLIPTAPVAAAALMFGTVRRLRSVATRPV